MGWMRAALISVMQLAISPSNYPSIDLSHLDICGLIYGIPKNAADVASGSETLQHFYRQLQASPSAIISIGSDDIEKAIPILRSLFAIIAAAIINETKMINAILMPYLQQLVNHWQIQNLQTQAALFLILAAIAMISIFKARLPSVFLGGDWGRNSSELDSRIKCIESLLRNLRINYVKERTCKYLEGDVTCAGEIDFFLYDDDGPITIIEDKATIENDEVLRNIRAQARSYCMGLYIFENIIVNSFVIASKEGLRIYRIIHNEDHLVEEVSSAKLDGFRRRWIKEKLLEIR